MYDSRLRQETMIADLNSQMQLDLMAEVSPKSHMRTPSSRDIDRARRTIGQQAHSARLRIAPHLTVLDWKI